MSSVIDEAIMSLCITEDSDRSLCRLRVYLHIAQRLKYLPADIEEIAGLQYGIMPGNDDRYKYVIERIVPLLPSCIKNQVRKKIPEEKKIYSNHVKKSLEATDGMRLSQQHRCLDIITS